MDLKAYNKGVVQIFQLMRERNILANDVLERKLRRAELHAKQEVARHEHYNHGGTQTDVDNELGNLQDDIGKAERKLSEKDNQIAQTMIDLGAEVGVPTPLRPDLG